MALLCVKLCYIILNLVVHLGCVKKTSDLHSHERTLVKEFEVGGNSENIAFEKHHSLHLKRILLLCFEAMRLKYQ